MQITYVRIGIAKSQRFMQDNNNSGKRCHLKCGIYVAFAIVVIGSGGDVVGGGSFTGVVGSGGGGGAFIYRARVLVPKTNIYQNASLCRIFYYCYFFVSFLAHKH